MEEVNIYTPYLLLEQILFFHGFGVGATRGLRCEYERRVRVASGRASAVCCDPPCKPRSHDDDNALENISAAVPTLVTVTLLLTINLLT